MSFFNVEEISVRLCVCAQKWAMCQIGSANLSASQMFRVFKVQIVRTVVKHMNHLVCQDSLHEPTIPRSILANNNLVEFGIITSSHRIITNFAWEVSPQIYRTDKVSKLKSCFSFQNLSCALPASWLESAHHRFYQWTFLYTFIHVIFTSSFIIHLATFFHFENFQQRWFE